MITGISKYIQYHYIDLNKDIPDLRSVRSWLPDNLKTASKKRKEEYLTGRLCAKEACKKLGFNLQKLDRSDVLAPIWPDDIVGSISHSHGLVIAAVVPKKDCPLLGLDIEKLISSKRIEAINKMVLRQEDMNLIQEFGAADSKMNLFFYTLIFSAKEAFYKFLYPRCQLYFGFKEAYIPEVDLELGEIILELDSKKDELKAYNGRFKGKFKQIEGSVMVLFEA